MNDPITVLKVCFTVYFFFKYDSVYIHVEEFLLYTMYINILVGIQILFLIYKSLQAV